MPVTLNGTTGITTDGGYVGDGVNFADNTPANTLITTAAGNLLVGTTSVIRNSILSVSGDIAVDGINFGSPTSSTYIYESTANAITIRTNTSAAFKYFTFGTDGRFSALNGPCAGIGAYINLSDLNSKTNIVAAPYGLADVMKLNPVMFNLMGAENKEIGFIAQEVQQVIPEVVTQFDEDRLGLQSSDLIAVLVKAIQEQQTLIQSLTARIEALEAV